MRGRIGTAGIDLVFDGECGFCTRAAAWLARRDRRGRIRLHPYQRPGVLERFGLSAAEAEQAAWAFVAAPDRGGADTNGEDAAAGLRGAAAVSLALDAAYGTRIFRRVYGLPLIRQMQDRAYRWVAEHRHRLRGVTPWCTAHPEDCTA